MATTEGVTQAFLDQSLVGTLRTVMWVAALVPAFFVALRLYVRIKVKASFGADDILAVIATVSQTTSSTAPI
jgi:hypothetical protein